MLTRICFAALLMFGPSLWSQEDVTTGSVGNTVVADSPMFTPAPISGEAYPNGGSAETRSNYLRGGLNFNGVYMGNAFETGTSHSSSDVSYSIWPTLGLDKSTSRFHSVFTFSPGFTFYQRNSSFDQVSQNLSADLHYRLSPHVSISFTDSFQKTSNPLNQPDLAFSGQVFGSVQAPTVVVIAPFAQQLHNTANMEITYQYDLNGMVGVSGMFTYLDYPSPAQVPGLFDSASKAGSAFYNHRLSKKHYFGIAYQYQSTLVHSPGVHSILLTHTASAFYTLYLSSSLSLSVSGGPQLAKFAESHQSASRNWSPSVSASLGWQGRRTSLATSYSHVVTSGGGLYGAAHASSANASASWQFTRSWTFGISATYSIYKNSGSLLIPFIGNGHTLLGSASIQRQLGEHVGVQAGYTRLHQVYGSIAALSGAPDTNRESISVSYQFSRPLGR